MLPETASPGDGDGGAATETGAVSGDADGPSPGDVPAGAIPAAS